MSISSPSFVILSFFFCKLVQEEMLELVVHCYVKIIVFLFSLASFNFNFSSLNLLVF